MNKIFLLLLSLWSVLGCGVWSKSPPQTTRYVLEYAPPTAKGLAPLGHVLRIGRFSVSPTYNFQQMIYRERDYEREAYVYHLWWTNPADMITDLLRRDLQEAGLFDAVLPYGSTLRAGFALEGTVEAFYEHDGQAAWEAVLELTVTLVREREAGSGKGALWQRSYRAVERAEMKNPRAVAGAMSRAMARVSDRIIRDIHGSLAPETSGNR